MEKWKLGDYTFVYNPSSDSYNLEIQNINNYSIKGDHYGNYSNSFKTREFSTILYNGSGNVVLSTGNVVYSSNYCDISIYDNWIYTGYSGNRLNIRDLSNYQAQTNNFYYFGYTQIYGIAVDNITIPNNIDLYVYIDNKVKKCDKYGLSSIEKIITLTGGVLNCRSLTYMSGNLYTLHPDGIIYEINFTGNTSSIYYTLPNYSVGCNNYFSLKYDGYYFWYYDNLEDTYYQFDINKDKVVNIIPMNTLDINVSDIAINRDSYIFYFLYQNKVYKVVPNNINENLYKLLIEIGKHKVNLCDEFGSSINVLVNNFDIKEHVMDIDKPRYDINISVTVC